jgi:predicted nucleic acid-binding protein
MKHVFADTFYYLALLNPGGDDHEAAVSYTAQFSGRIVTTAWVITELANALARARNRALFLELLRDLQNDPRVTIFPPEPARFQRGIDLYAQRPDKDWSLTDCISFVVMEQEGLSDALTGDHHFEQAGFTPVLKPS